MRLSSIYALAVAVGIFASASGALADTTVTLSKVHLCCPQCVSAVKKTLDDFDGVTSEIDQKGKKVTITAKDDATAQKAVDALVEAGFYGKSDNDKVAPKKIDLPKGKVAKLELTGVHNCCKQCTATIKKVVEKVDGVTGTDVEPKVNTFTVEGNFDAAAVMQALLNAGFTVREKK